MDMKLDFVPPSLINFISRQLVGSGFRLYQKIVGSVSNYGEDYSKALEDPVYARIREALYSTGKPNEVVEGNVVKDDSSPSPREHSIKVMKENIEGMEQDVHERTDAGEFVVGNDQVINKKAFDEIDEDTKHAKDEENIMKQEVCSYDNDHAPKILQTIEPETSGKASGEIEEEENENSGHLENASKIAGTPPSCSRNSEKRLENLRRNAVVSSEVEQALETLEKAISVIREYKSNNVQARFSPALSSEEPPNLANGDEKGGTSTDSRKLAENVTTLVEDGGMCSNAEVSVEVSDKGKLVKRTSHESNGSNSIRRAGSNSHSSHKKIAPASPEQNLSVHGEHNPSIPSSSLEVEADVPDLTTQESKKTLMDVISMQENDLHKQVKSSPQKKHRVCCCVF